MANTENVLKVLELVRDPANFFSMKQFWVDPAYLECLSDALFEKCYGARKPEASTPSCIAGWANAAAGNALKDERAAAAFLGLPFPSVSDKLFRPRLERLKEFKHELSLISRAEAVATLERLAETGVVDWG
jgi:hypothetical protein